jgi:hypothetical protein
MLRVTLLNFDTELDHTIARKIVKKKPEVITPEVTEVKTAAPSTKTAFMTRSEDNWDWRDLRDYVVREIESRFGIFPRNLVKESGIFKSFCTRWGAKAPLIAKAVFEGHDGMWMGAPVSINRFTINSDPYFAEVIDKNFLGKQGETFIK